MLNNAIEPPKDNSAAQASPAPTGPVVATPAEETPAATSSSSAVIPSAAPAAIAATNSVVESQPASISASPAEALPKTFEELKAIVMSRLIAGLPGGIPTGLANALMVSLIIGMHWIFSNSIFGEFAGPFAMAIGQTLHNAYTLLMPIYVKATILILGGYAAVKHADLLQGTLKELLQTAPGKWAHALGGWIIPLLTYMLTKSPFMGFALSAGLSSTAMALKPLLDDPKFMEAAINIIKPILVEYKNDFVKLAQNWFSNPAAKPDIEQGIAQAQSVEGVKVLDAIVADALQAKGPELLAALNQAVGQESNAPANSAPVSAAILAASASSAPVSTSVPAASASSEQATEKKGVKRSADEAVKDDSYVMATDVKEMAVDGTPEEKDPHEESKRSRPSPT